MVNHFYRCPECGDTRRYQHPMDKDPPACDNCGSTSGLVKEVGIPNISTSKNTAPRDSEFSNQIDIGGGVTCCTNGDIKQVSRKLSDRYKLVDTTVTRKGVSVNFHALEINAN